MGGLRCLAYRTQLRKAEAGADGQEHRVASKTAGHNVLENNNYLCCLHQAQCAYPRPLPRHPLVVLAVRVRDAHPVVPLHPLHLGSKQGGRAGV